MKGVHHGWWIVLSGMLTLFSCLGLARFSFGLLLPEMASDLQLAYDQMGLISTANFCGYLLAVALAPRLIRVCGPRWLIAAGLLLNGLCMFGLGASFDLLMLVLFYGLVGVGSGLANIPTMVLVSHWFHRNRRGLAAGLMIAGNGVAIILAGLFLPQINQMSGWRSSWQLLAVVSLVVMLVALVLNRDHPQALSLDPLGQEEQSPEPGQGQAQRRLLLQLGVLYLIFGLTYMVYGTFLVTSLIQEFGYSAEQAGGLWSWVGVFGIFSGVAFGWISDRIGRRKGMLLVYLLFAVAYLLVGSAAYLGDFAVLVSVILYGAVLFAVPTIMAAAVAEYLGLANAARGFSVLTLFFAAGQIVGPGSAGLLAQWSGSFLPCYLLSGFLCLAAMLVARQLPQHQV